MFRDAIAFGSVTYGDAVLYFTMWFVGAVVAYIYSQKDRKAGQFVQPKYADEEFLKIILILLWPAPAVIFGLWFLVRSAGELYLYTFEAGAVIFKALSVDD